MKHPIHVLIIEDSEDDALLLTNQLQHADFDVQSERVETASSFISALESKEWDIILCDYKMPKFNGMKALSIVKERGIDVPFIFVSGTIGEERAIEAMKAGAHDYVLKGNVKRLIPAIERELRDANDRKKYKRAEEELRNSEAEFRSLFEYSTIGKSVTTLDGRLIKINRAFASMLGYSIEEMEDLNFLEITHLEDRASSQEAVRCLLTGAKSAYRMEKRYYHKNGSIVWTDVGITLLRDSNNIPLHFITSIQDITDRKQSEEARKKLEAQLQQAQKLESIGTLASGIAHDFNNILGIIMGYSTLLNRYREDLQKHSEGVAAIEKAAQRGAALVKQLLIFARKNDALLESLSVNGIIVEITSLLQQTFPKTIEISTSLQQDLPAIVADASQIHQVLLNLCVNARDAMPNNGTLSISSKSVHGEVVRARFAEAVARQYVQIEVADTGTGMDEQTRQRIFEPFFTTKGPGKGTGLGLAVVFGIVEHHGGFIDVRSAPGEGTSFIVYLPIPEREVEVLQPVRKDLEEIPGGTETILIIEDEEILQELLKASLASNGYTILTADDGVQGVKMYQSHRNEIAAVVSDMGLPLLNGQDVFRKIREINPEAKVILASGFCDPEMKTEMYKAGLKDFIQKPYLPEEILRKIRETIDTK